MRGREIKLEEEEGDAIYHEAVGALFAGSARRARRDQVEGALRHAGARARQCVDVANVLQSISLKNA